MSKLHTVHANARVSTSDLQALWYTAESLSRICYGIEIDGYFFRFVPTFGIARGN